MQDRLWNQKIPQPVSFFCHTHIAIAELTEEESADGA